MAITLRSSSEISYPILSAGAFTATLSVRETGPVDAAKPRLLDRVREAIRTRHYSRRTEKAYVHWIKRSVPNCWPILRCLDLPRYMGFTSPRWTIRGSTGS